MTSQGDDDARREQNKAIVLKIMDLISNGKGDDMVDLVSDDFTFELPYGGDMMPGPVAKPEWAVMQNQTFKMFSSFKLLPIEFHDQLDPDDLIAEYRSDSVVAANNKPYRNRYIGVFKFRDGQVTFWREFHNPAVVTEAMS